MSWQKEGGLAGRPISQAKEAPKFAAQSAAIGEVFLRIIS
jgi:hypothetical protein